MVLVQEYSLPVQILAPRVVPTAVGDVEQQPPAGVTPLSFPSTPERPRVGPSAYISPHGLHLVETSRICAPRAARAPLSPPAKNALFGWVFKFLKNAPQAGLSGFEVPPGA